MTCYRKANRIDIDNIKLFIGGYLYTSLANPILILVGLGTSSLIMSGIKQSLV